MKTEIEKIGLMDLSKSEIRSINGGGPTWTWFGTVLGCLSEAVDIVNELPRTAAIAVVTIQAKLEETIDVIKYH